MKLSRLILEVAGARVVGPLDAEITAVFEDSRLCVAGCVYVARSGAVVDGRKFIPEAVRAGAAAVVLRGSVHEEAGAVPQVLVPDPAVALALMSAALHGHPARQLVMIGVTGTDGKTTTATLIHAILCAAGLRAGLISTIHAVIGNAVVETGLHVTTPNAPAVQALLARMLAAGITHCVLEVTSHALVQQRVAGIEFDSVVFTNITHDHIDFHGTPEAYLAAKAHLLALLAPRDLKPGVAKIAVLNRDDAAFEGLAQCYAGLPVQYGTHAAAHVRATDVQSGADGTRFMLQVDGTSFSINTALLGDFNLHNCLAAAACALHLPGVTADAVQRGIASVAAVAGRMERIDAGQEFLALVDFAHTPNSLRSALHAARQLCGGRLWVVFGAAGLRDTAKRRWMGTIAAELADYIVITAEDPRTESLPAIMEEIAAGCTAGGGVRETTFWLVPDRAAAIAFAVQRAAPHDVVLACGKAHEQSMCFGEVEFPWDERTVMRAALAVRLGHAAVPAPVLPTAV